MATNEIEFVRNPKAGTWYTAKFLYGAQNMAQVDVNISDAGGGWLCERVLLRVPGLHPETFKRKVHHCPDDLVPTLYAASRDTFGPELTYHFTVIADELFDLLEASLYRKKKRSWHQMRATGGRARHGGRTPPP